MSGRHAYMKRAVWSVLCAVLFVLSALAQPKPKSYSVKGGRMIIEISKGITKPSLDSFISQFDLADIGLSSFIFKGIFDSLKKEGWQVDAENDKKLVISKSLEVLEDMKHPADKFFFPDKRDAFLFPSVNNGELVGYNRFRNKNPFRTEGSMVTFFLRNHLKASKVLLAGSFTTWQYNALAMKKTDSGWIVQVKLEPGKYWYKFIANDQWMIDADNSLQEPDGRGNVNSVFYKSNFIINLAGYTQAKKVFVAGSFNNWSPNELQMVRTPNGWTLPLYLAEGTHTYRFVVDGKWMDDPANPLKFNNEFGEYNSVIQIGKPYLFTLLGYASAQHVFLSGSFNNWRAFELKMNKTASGWQLPYVLGPGNYQYRFLVDGKSISDPANPVKANKENSFLIISPNYTFRLKGFATAKKVFLAGDFNAWDPSSLQMRREGTDWVFSVHLSPGKHVYKFIVDGKWIIDPANKLWEQNENDSGNSVLWIEQ